MPSCHFTQEQHFPLPHPPLPSCSSVRTPIACACAPLAARSNGQEVRGGYSWGAAGQPAGQLQLSVLAEARAEHRQDRVGPVLCVLCNVHRWRALCSPVGLRDQRRAVWSGGRRGAEGYWTCTYGKMQDTVAASFSVYSIVCFSILLSQSRGFTTLFYTLHYYDTYSVSTAPHTHSLLPLACVR